MLRATDTSQKFTVRVTRGKRAVTRATVKIAGPGIEKTVRTGKNGKVVVRLTPMKPGIVRVSLAGRNACNSQRIGVVGTFEPPVTG
jgi:hypothetical protein